MNVTLPFLLASSFLTDLIRPAWPGAPEWLSGRVLTCVAIAVCLMLVSLALKGVQKIITLAVAAAVVVGGFWLVQDAWTARNEILPPELATEVDALADRVLKTPAAKAAWERVQAGWGDMKPERQATLAAGGDPARDAISDRVDVAARDLQRQGQRTAAEELRRFAQKISPED